MAGFVRGYFCSSVLSIIHDGSCCTFLCVISSLLKSSGLVMLSNLMQFDYLPQANGIHLKSNDTHKSSILNKTPETISKRSQSPSLLST